MWTNNPLKFALKYNATLSQVKRFQCTGEHLVAHQDGGSSAPHNIVAVVNIAINKDINEKSLYLQNNIRN